MFKKNVINHLNQINLSMGGSGEAITVGDIFNPTESTYKYCTIDFDDKLTPEEFKNASHYILLQNVKINKIGEEVIELKKWQHCLITVLAQTSLTSYCQKIRNVSTLEVKDEMLYELFWQMHKSPTGFLLSANKEGKVKVMAYFLAR